MATGSLTARQRAFVDAYLVSGNATDAALTAGYSARRAKQQGSYLLVTNRDVQAELASRRALAVSRADDSAADVLRDAIATYHAAMADGQFSAATSALRVRASRHPEFSEKHEVTGDYRIRVEALSAVAHMSAEELRELAERARS